VIIAVLGLVVTLLFNTVGVWAQYAQSRTDAKRALETRRFTEIGMLTQLSSEARASQRAISTSNLVRLSCQKNPNHSRFAASPDDAALEQALGVYDFMAWLFNSGELDMPSARAMWGPRLDEAARMARTLKSQQELDAEWPQLAAFARQSHMPALQVCP
jgi:hypothetical protein